MKPHNFSPAHHNENLAEVVCSNSFKSTLLSTASGVLKEELKNGVSLLKARETALIKTAPDIDAEVLKQPNNVLGIEYVKAILKNNYDIKIDVIDRKGSDYNDSCLSNAYPSALAIRSAIENNNLESVKDFVPNFVNPFRKSEPNLAPADSQTPADKDN